jgi:drug/metabolite transporter (DMT)-like permease
MIYCLLAPFCFAAFSLIIRHAQRLQVDMLVVGAANYAFGAAVFAVLALHQGLPPVPPVAGLGVLAGVIFVSGYFVLIATMSDRGVSLTSALMQLSVLIPMVASLALWHEALSTMKAVGAGLCLVAMPLIILDRGVSTAPLTWRRFTLSAGMFLANGLALLCSKGFQVLGHPEQLHAYSALLFGAATVGGVAVAARTRARVTAAAVGWGVLLGASNAGSVLLLIVALQHAPGFVVFPVVAALSLGLVALFAATVWREAPGKLGVFGLALTVAAAVLANT